MKPFFVLLGLLFLAPIASAQITFDQVKSEPAGTVMNSDIKPVAVDPATYFSPARERARRAAIRKERNHLEYGAALMGTVTSFNESWIETSGGDNSVGFAAVLYLYHTYTKDKFSLLSKFDAKFGYNRMNVERTVTQTDGTSSTTKTGTWFKYQDEFVISTSPAYAISRDWALASILRFRSQFANGFISRSQQTHIDRKSMFMAPGYFDASIGFTYTSPDKRWPFKVNISPLALSAVFVKSALVRHNLSDSKAGSKLGWQAYGLVNADKTSKVEGGSSIQVDFDRTFDKKGIFRYRTTFYSFMGWISASHGHISHYNHYKTALAAWETGGKVGDAPMLSIHPTVRWVNTFDIKATKFLTTSFYFQLYYNRAQNLDLQTQLLLSVGLTYTFNSNN